MSSQIPVFFIAAMLLLDTAAHGQGNLITNGDFSLGNTGFTSDFDYFASTNTNAKQYGIAANPAYVVQGAANYFDHTVGNANGQMMVVNGIDDATDVNRTVWSQSVPVSQNTSYDFSLWSSSWFDDEPAELELQVNGQTVGNPFSAPSQAATWDKYATSWNSSTSSQATLSIINSSSAHGGNDFAIDDLFFGLQDSPTSRGIIAPSSVATSEGNQALNLLTGTRAFRHQQVFDASQFGSTPQLITELRFRPESLISSPPNTPNLPATINIPNVQFNLSTTASQPDGLSATFAENIGCE